MSQGNLRNEQLRVRDLVIEADNARFELAAFLFELFYFFVFRLTGLRLGALFLSFRVFGWLCISFVFLGFLFLGFLYLRKLNFSLSRLLMRWMKKALIFLNRTRS